MQQTQVEGAGRVVALVLGQTIRCEETTTVPRPSHAGKELSSTAASLASEPVPFGAHSPTIELRFMLVVGKDTSKRRAKNTDWCSDRKHLTSILTDQSARLKMHSVQIKNIILMEAGSVCSNPMV